MENNNGFNNFKPVGSGFGSFQFKPSEAKNEATPVSVQEPVTNEVVTDEINDLIPEGFGVEPIAKSKTKKSKAKDTNDEVLNEDDIFDDEMTEEDEEYLKDIQIDEIKEELKPTGKGKGKSKYKSSSSSDSSSSSSSSKSKMTDEEKIEEDMLSCETVKVKVFGNELFRLEKADGSIAANNLKDIQKRIVKDFDMQEFMKCKWHFIKEDNGMASLIPIPEFYKKG